MRAVPVAVAWPASAGRCPRRGGPRGPARAGGAVAAVPSSAIEDSGPTLAEPERAQPSPGLERASLAVTWRMPLISGNRDSDQKGRARAGNAWHAQGLGLGPSPPLAVTLILRQLGRAQVPKFSESMGPGRPARVAISVGLSAGQPEWPSDSRGVGSHGRRGQAPRGSRPRSMGTGACC